MSLSVVTKPVDIEVQTQQVQKEAEKGELTTSRKDQN